MTGFRRARVVAAFGLVVALGIGWLVTSRAGQTRDRSGAVATTGRLPTRPPSVPDASERLRSLVPAGERCAPPTGSDLRCRAGVVQVDLRLVPPGSLASVYLDAVGDLPGRSRDGPVGCARGAPDERAWSRPSTPRRAAGRFACEVADGHAAMWWTVADRSLLAHAVARNRDLAALFSWWCSHSER